MHNLFLDGYLIFENSSFELLANVVYLCYLLKCGMWDKYNFVLIDCPPNVGVFAINALMASDGVIIPVDMSYLGLLGVQGIEHALTLVRDQLDHPIAIAGVLATRYDRRNNLSKEVLDALTEHFGSKMFKTVIPETVKIREAPSHGQSIFEYDPNGVGASSYRELVSEVYKWQ
ncbi:MAG: ParA family protein [Gloeotrichia echinulata DEX184]